MFDSCRLSQILLLVAVLATTAVASAARSGYEIIDPSEVKPGSRGVCVTEMDGGERFEIPLTVLGTTVANRPEDEMVLVRLHDPRFAKVGIIAGMSGSPVYVQGRLLGALAFGWNFAKDPIGGVKPFTRMLELADQARPAPTRGDSTRPPLAELQRSWQDGTLGQLVIDWLQPPSSLTSDHLPVTISGTLQPGAANSNGWLAESRQRLGWLSTPSSSGRAGTSRGEVSPGSMVAAVLMEGDLTFAAGGTLTEVRGDQVWAFGHPFLGLGGFSFPLARAEVITVIASQLSSFKMFSTGETIGAIHSDGTHGVWGRLGDTVPMIPLTVMADDRTYEFRCVRHPLLLPLLAAFSTVAGHSAQGRNLGDQTAQVRVAAIYDSAANGSQEVVLGETFVGSDAVNQAAALVAALLGYLENSVHLVPDLARIRITLTTTEETSGAELIDAVPERTRVRPGEILHVRLRLRPHRGQEYIQRFAIGVPAGIPPGKLDLIVADGTAWSAYDLKMRPSRPVSFAGEVAQLGRLLPSTHLVLALERREVGVALPGGSLEMPPSIALALRSGLGPELKLLGHFTVQQVAIPMPFPMTGARRIPLQVRQDEFDLAAEHPDAAAEQESP